MLFDMNRLHQEVEALAPIYGLSVGTPSDPKTWRIDFKPEANDAQRSAVMAFISKADPASWTISEGMQAALAWVDAQVRADACAKLLEASPDDPDLKATAASLQAQVAAAAALASAVKATSSGGVSASTDSTATK